MLRIYERYFARQIYLAFIFILFAFSGLFFFFDLINELSEAMTVASICGLGQVASNPITTVIKFFPEEVNKYLAANGRK